MAPARTILGALRADDVVIPFWLRVAGVVVGAAVAVLVVVSAFTAGHPTRPPPPPPPPPPSARAAPGPAATGAAATVPAPGSLPYLPPPLTGAQFHDPATVAAAFATAYETWVSPDGPPGSAARVEPYATADLFAHFPEPTSWVAPSALAAIDSVTVAAASPATRVATVSLTQHLVGQDGRPIGAPQTSTMAITVDQQSDGEWLVGRFTTGS